MNKTILIILFIVSCFDAIAQDSLKTKKYTLNGYVKFLQTNSFEEIDEAWITDNMLHNRINFKWYPKSTLTINIEMRNRFFYGESVKLIPSYNKYIDIEKGFIDLSDVLFMGKSYFLHSCIDRASLKWEKGKWQLTFGRQRINWAQTFAWNPNDLFNTYSFFDFDYEEKPGSDAMRVIYYRNASSQIELAVKGDDKDRITAAALYKFNRWCYDIQLLGGLLNDEDIVLGAGWSGQVFKGGFRGEASYFHPYENLGDTSGSLLASIGYDYTFKKGLMLQGEILFNSTGSADDSFNLAAFYFKELSAKNLSFTKWSFFVSAAYPFTPILSGTLSAMYSPNDQSLFAGPSIVYSLDENLDLSFTVQSFWSGKQSYLGGKGTFAFLRLKKSF